jgi:hypothetical protein
MIELFQELFSDVNLPATVLMVGVLLYWMMVIVGVFGMDVIDLDFGDADVDIGLDADVGIDADVGVDADLGVDVHSGVDAAPATTMSGGSSTTGNDGFLKSVFEYFYLGEVPIVIVGTFIVLFLWIFTYLTNHHWNPDKSLWVAAGWFVPNLIVSLILTRYTMIPFAIIFRKPPPENKTREEMYGRVGKVTTSEVTDKFGQIELKLVNEPEMTLNVRTKPGVKLGKGDAAKIISYDHTNGTFLVELTKWEKKIDG